MEDCETSSDSETSTDTSTDTSSDTSSESETCDNLSEEEIEEKYSRFKDAISQYEQDDDDEDEHVAHLSEDLDIIFEKDNGQIHFMRTMPVNGVRKFIKYGEKFTCIGYNFHVERCEIENKQMIIQTPSPLPQIAKVFKNPVKICEGKFSVIFNEIEDLPLEPQRYVNDTFLEYFWTNPLVVSG